MMGKQRFFDWSELTFSIAEYRQRRQKLQQLLQAAGGGIFLAPSRYGVSAGSTFRQLDDFFYFTGLELPDSMLAIDADNNETILFVPEQDGRFYNPTRLNDFPGRPLANDAELSRRSGIGEIRPFSQLATDLKQQNCRIHLNPHHPRPLEPLKTGFIQQWQPVHMLIYHLQQTFPTLQLHNAFSYIAQLRMIKSPAELAIMRQAFHITMNAIRKTARAITSRC